MFLLEQFKNVKKDTFFWLGGGGGGGGATIVHYKKLLKNILTYKAETVELSSAYGLGLYSKT